MHSEITEAGGGGKGGPNNDAETSGRKRKPESDEINPKIKQFFRKRTEVKPFYSGGKIAVLSECHFACQCGPAVNVVSTRAAIKPKKEPDAMEEDDEDDDDVEISVSQNGESTEECFQIISHFENDLDEIIAFDACPSTHLLVTSHKSTLLRIWDLDKNEVTKTVKSLHNLPIGLIEIHKVRAKSILQSKLKPSSKGSPSPSREAEDVVVVPTYEEATLSTRADLVWTTVSGAVVKVWDLGGNQVSRAIQIGSIASIGFAKWKEDNSKRLFVAERNIYVIDSDKGQGSEMQYKVSQTLEGHYSQVTGIEFALDGSIMISGGRDKVVILWQEDKKNGSYSRVKTIPMPESVESLVLTSPSDLYLALSPHDIRHYDVGKNKLSKRSVLEQNLDEPVTGLYAPLKSSEDATRDYFFTTTHSSAMFRLEPKGAEQNLEITKQYVGCLDEILCIVFWTSPDEIAVANNTSVIKVYNLGTGQCRFLRGHKDIVLTLDSKDDFLISGSKDNTIILWTKSSETPQTILEGHLASVTAVCFTPTNSFIYSVSEDNFLKLWDSKSPSSKCLKSQPAHDKEIHSVHCSPNGSLVITSSRDKTAKVWDAETLDLVGILKGHKKSVWDARFSSWDQLAVTSSADTTIKIWNLVSYNCIQTLQGHLSSVLQAMFVNTGLQICSSSSDGTMRLWDLKTSACVSTEECGNDKIWTTAAQPDLSVIVTGSADSIISVWEDITEEKVQEVNAKRRKYLEEEQKLNNVIRSGQWQEAFRLAVELDRPFTLLKIIRELKDPVQELIPIVHGLTLDLKSQLLDYIKKWNTNTKTSTEAQYLLNTILRTTSFQLFEKSMPTEALIAYTQKHYNRLRTHRERVAVIQYFANKDQLIG